ncbi:oligomeric Golgi complex subunit 3 [Oopsacas minuta]|uniref:Oligomeric Golgi complex subunit 3 n=1 Tax=Oopsacas minuta TaxID=111878 RepID=A0AAV7JQ97_9METZ|nr:oligomeric Golgi complex subunit 3 [Oopsacas minuta]
MILSKTNSIHSYLLSNLGSSKSQSTSSPADQHAMWYPTVRRTLLCLSKLYHCVDKSIFESISQEAIVECIKSLQSAAKLIAVKKGNLDSSLFLIKHLLILREQLIPFEVEFSVKETILDFTRTKEKAKELFSHKKRNKIFNLDRTNALLEFLLEGAPELREKILNSKKDVDIVLKTSCEELINHLTSLLIHPLAVLLDKFRNFKQLSQQNESIQLSSILKQPFADPQTLHKEMENTMSLMKSKVPVIFESMQTYLIYTETIQILFRPVRLNVHNQFQELLALINLYFPETDKLIIACPSAEEISFALMYTFPSNN